MLALFFPGPAFDYVENALGKYANEGPFFLGKFGLVSGFPVSLLHS
jgi:hypothetical protein